MSMVVGSYYNSVLQRADSPMQDPGTDIVQPNCNRTANYLLFDTRVFTPVMF